MFRRKPPPPAIPPEWILVGLGNPGPEYRGTRHNLGFEVIDLLAQTQRIKLDRSKYQARYGQGEIGGHGVLLVKPMTYVNLSGQAVAPFMRQFGLKPDHVLVVADDLDLELGRLRLKPKGSAGGHNGHKAIIHALGSQDYPRLKIGIGSVDRSETIGHVLGGFNRPEREAIDIAVRRAVEGVIRVIEDGLDAGMNAVNEGARDEGPRTRD